MAERIIVEGMDRDRVYRMYLALERAIPDEAGVLRTSFPSYRLALLGRMVEGELVLAGSHSGLEIKVDSGMAWFESTQTIIVEDGRVYHGWLQKDGTIFDRKMTRSRLEATLDDIYGKKCCGKNRTGSFDNAYGQIIADPQGFRPF